MPPPPHPEPTRHRALRAAAVLAVSAALVGFGIRAGGGLPDLGDSGSRTPSKPAPAAPDVQALDGQRAEAPFLGLFNGEASRSQRYVSDLAPHEVADLYARQFGENNLLASHIEDRQVAALARTAYSRQDTPYFSIVSTRDPEGKHIGIVALPRAEGGSTYFLSETESTELGQTPDPPAPNRPRPIRDANDPYDVPAPPFATERFDIGDLGEPGARIVLYESRSDRSHILEHYRQTLPQMGWHRLEEEDKIINQRLPRGYLLLFRRGPQELIVATMPRSNGQEAVTLVFRNKKKH